MPFSRASLAEWISLRTGGWEYWIPGYTDGHNWIPVEEPPEAIGPHADLIRAYQEEDGKSDGAYVHASPHDLALRSLFIRRTLRRASVRSVSAVDFPIGGKLEESDTKWLEKAQPLARRALEAAIEGEKQEPDNAFFPFAQALAAEILRKQETAFRALQRASKCKFYNDRWYESDSIIQSLAHTHLYYMVSDIHNNYSDMSTEFFHLARLLLRRETDDKYLRIGHLVNVSYLSALNARSVEEFRSTRLALHGLANEGTRNLMTEKRRPNEGDKYRFLTQVQEQIAASGFITMVDLPSFAASEPAGWWFGDRAEAPAELSERSFFAMLYYEDALLKGVVAAEAMIAMCLAALIMLGASKLRWLTWNTATTPALLACCVMIVTCVSSEWKNANEVFLAILFLCAFLAGQYETLKLFSAVLSAGAAVLAVLLTITLDLHGASGNEFIAGVVYFVALARYLWLRGKTSVASSIAAVAGIVACGLAGTTTWPVPFTEHIATFAAASVLALVGVAVWYRCVIPDAATRLWKVLPFGLLIGCVAVIAAGMWRAYIVQDMHWLLGVEREMTENWRERLTELGPPVLEP